MKCDKCGETIENTFLGKIRGTYLMDEKKLKALCSNCQKKAPL